MATNKLQIDPKKLKGSKLYIIDVSSVMRSNYVKLSEEQPVDAPQNYYSNNKFNKFQKKELSWLVDGEKVNTSSLYGLLRLFSTYGFNDHFIFCFDTPKNFRRDESEEYKQGRQKAEDDYFVQVNIARDLLTNVGFTTHSVDGYEADDFVVESVNKNKEFFDHIFVVSNDFDMAQNVDENVYFKNVIKTRGDINKSNYEEMLKCPYNSILLYKAMVGDPSDKIKGIKGFGPKAFYKFIEDENIYNDLHIIRKQRKEYNILKDSVFLDDEQRKQALKSLSMIVPRFPKEYDNWSPKQRIDKDMLELYLEKYGMKSIAKKLK
jgi:DNA polymerase-1